MVINWHPEVVARGPMETVKIDSETLAVEVRRAVADTHRPAGTHAQRDTSRTAGPSETEN